MCHTEEMIIRCGVPSLVERAVPYTETLERRQIGQTERVTKGVIPVCNDNLQQTVVVVKGKGSVTRREGQLPQAHFNPLSTVLKSDIKAAFEPRAVLHDRCQLVRICT